MHHRSIVIPAAILLAIALSLLAPVVPARAQTSADPERSLEKYKEYLDQKPYHAWGFDKLVEAAVSANQLAALVESYEKLVEGDSANQPARIVLARLYARSDQIDRALAMLSTVTDDSPELPALRGELELAAGKTAEAIASLDLAAERTKDRRALAEIHRKRGEAYLRSGDRERAVGALRTLSELEPENFHTRLDVAAALSANGLISEAQSELAAARDLAGEDNAKRCRVLAEIGRLHERQLQMGEALDVYRDGLERMARGHWLKSEFYRRILSIHRRRGSLEAALGEAREVAAAHPQDIGAREFLADILLELDRPAEAREVIAESIADFPDDESLGLRLVEILEELGDTEAVIVEYQRQLERRPQDLELYIALGTLFARSEKLEQARRQWQRALENDIDDPGLCSRLASLFALFGMEEDAEALHEKAIALEPQEMRHYSDIVQFLVTRDPPRPVEEWLARAEAAAAGSAGMLEEVSLLRRQNRDLEGCRRCLEGALALRVDDPRLLASLADLELELGEHDAALARLERVIELAEGVQSRQDALGRIVREVGKSGESAQWIDRMRARIAADPAPIAPHLLLGALLERAEDPTAAAAVYERFLADHAPLEEVYQSIARIRLDLGDHRGALETYTRLTESAPQSRRKYLREIANIHLALFNQEAALAVYEEILKSSGRNPSAYRDVAKEYQKLNYTEEAIECYEQAVRLDPTSVETRLELVALERSLGRFAEAERHLAEVLRIAPAEDRPAAAQSYYETLAEQGKVEPTIEALRAAIEENPYDVESPRLLCELYVRELEYELALEMLERLLAYQPESPLLLELRGEMLFAMERFPEAIADYETLLQFPDVDRTAMSLAVVRAAIGASDLDRARRVAATIADATAVAGVFRQQGLLDDAVAVLERAAAREPRSATLQLRLARIHEERGDLDASIACLERALAVEGDRPRTLAQLGDLYQRRNRPDGVTECGRRMLALLQLPLDDSIPDEEERGAASVAGRTQTFFASSGSGAASSDERLQRALSEISSYFSSKGLSKSWAEIILAEAMRIPRNQMVFEHAYSALSRADGDPARADELWRRAWVLANEEGYHPPAYTAQSWRENLLSRRSSTLSRTPEQCRAVIAQTEAELAERPTEEGFVLVATLYAGLREEAKQSETLDRGRAIFPDSARLAYARGQIHAARKEYAEADALYRVALERTVDPDPAEWQRRDDIAFERSRVSLLRSLPSEARREATDAELRRAYDMFRSRVPFATWAPGGTLWRGGIERMIAANLFKLDREEEALAMLRALVPDDPDALQDRQWLGTTLQREERFAEADEVLMGLIARRDELFADPRLRPLMESRMSWFGQIETSVARIREQDGRFIESYELFRRGHQNGPALVVLKTSAKLAEATQLFRERFGEAEGQVAALAADAAERPAALVRARELGIMLSELLLEQGEIEEAAAITERLCALLPEEFELRTVLALYQERLGRLDEAIALHQQVIDIKRALPRKGKSQFQQQRYEPKIAPTRPPLDPSANDWRWQNLRQSQGFYSGRGGAPLPNESPIENYSDILRIRLNRGETSEAAQMMRRMAREDARSYRNVSYALGNVMEQYQFGETGIPILRLLHTQDPMNQQAAHAYALALEKAERFEEAKKVALRTIGDLRGRNSNYYFVQQLEGVIDRADERLGLETGIEELAAEVAAQPKNGKLRIDLAERLFDERRFAEAWEQARVAEEIAPHLDESRDIALRCLRVLGRHDEVARRLERRADQQTDPEQRLRDIVDAAQALLRRGERDAACELVRTQFQATGGNRWNRYSASGWFLELGDPRGAAATLEAEIAAFQGPPAEVATARSKLARVQSMLGDPSAMLDGVIANFSLAKERHEKAQLMVSLVTSILDLVDVEGFAPLLEERLVAVEPVAAHSLRVALALARADTADALVRIAEAKTALGDEALHLVPLELAVLRHHEEWGGAAAVLEGLIAGDELSRQKFSTAGVAASEYELAQAELAEIYHELGREAESAALLEELDDEDIPESRKLLAQLYLQMGQKERARDKMLAYLEKIPNRQAEDVLLLATLHRDLGEFEAALRRNEEARAIATGQQQGRVVELEGGLDPYELEKQRGRRAEYLAELRARLEKDPKDAASLRVLAIAAIEDGDDAVYLRVLERMFEVNPRQLAYFWATQLEERGRVVDAIAALRKAVEDQGTDVWARRNLCQQLEALYDRAGDEENAAWAFRQRFEDPEGTEAMEALASRESGRGRFAEARTIHEALRTKLGKRWRAHAALADILVRLGEPRAALDLRLEAALDPEQTLVFTSSGSREVLDLEAELGAEAKGDEALAAEPESLPALRTCLYWKVQKEKWDEAAGLLERLLARDPRDLAAVFGKLHLLGRQRREEELAAYAAEVRDWLIDEVRGTGENRSLLQQVNDILVRAFVARGELDRALEIWRRPMGYFDFESYYYRIDQDVLQVPVVSNYLVEHGLYDRALAAQIAEVGSQRYGGSTSTMTFSSGAVVRVRSGGAGIDPSPIARLLDRLGRGEEARRMLWEYLHRSAQAEIFAIEDPYNRGTYRQDFSSVPIGELVLQHQAAGDIEALRARASELRRAHPEEPVWMGLERQVLTALEDHAAHLEVLRAALEETPDDRGLRWQLADRAFDLGNHEEALAALLEEERRTRVEAVRALRFSDSYSTMSSSKPPRLRFQWASRGGMGGGSSSYYGGGGMYLGSRIPDDREHRIIVCLHRLGRSDEAVAREVRLVGRSADRFGACQQIADALLRFELLERAGHWIGEMEAAAREKDDPDRLWSLRFAFAEKLLEEERRSEAAAAFELLERDLERVAPQRIDPRADVAERRAKLARARGDEGAHAAAIAERLGIFDERIAAAPGGVDGLLLERARFLAGEEAWEDAERTAERAIEAAPREPEPWTILGWARLRTGRAAEAAEAFDRAQELAFLQGRGDVPEITYGRGFARKESPEGERLLRWAMARLGGDAELREEADDWLESR